MVNNKLQLKLDSWLVSAGRGTVAGDPLNVPIAPASNFLYGSERAYSRNDGTRGWEAFEELVGGLESGTAVAFASGMAAISSVFSQVGVGGSLALPDDCYQGVVGLAEEGVKQGRWTVTRIGVGDTQRWIQACKTSDLVWLESPSNPLLTVTSLDEICQAPRNGKTIVAVDNTFATPLNQRPLDLGATVSIQSATKFIGGHSDLLAGVATTRDQELESALRGFRQLNGATPGALEMFLAIRGARTLSIRLERAQSNAMTLATRLEQHPAIEKVRYPGLLSHPTHEVAKRNLDGFGSILSFDVRGGASAADFVCQNVQLIRHATSLGAVESTIERRAAVAGQEHLPPSLLRLSVGIENPEDLWADLDSALNRMPELVTL